MKINRLILILVAFILASTACDPYKIDIPVHNNGSSNTGNNNNNNNNNNNGGDNTGSETEKDDIYTVKYATPGQPKVKTLKTTGYFKEQTVKKGITYYSFYGNDDITKKNQNVNVIEIDLDNPAYKIEFLFTSRSTTAQAGANQNALIALNAAYEQDATYNRTKGTNHSQVTIEPGHLRFWKHEAALVGDGFRKMGIIHGAKGTKNVTDGGVQAIDIYKKLTEKNIFSSSPMLIDDYNPVGTMFVPEPYNSMTLSQLSSSGLDSEDYRYHQAYRHPRTAVAVTEDNDLLLITVDGRYSGKAEGMSAKELTLFIQKHFDPRWAINMDGGGSTSMYIKGFDSPCGVDGIVNHPCNSGSTWSKAVLRELTTFLLVKYDE